MSGADPGRRHGRILAVLLLLFCFRVAAQLIQLAVETDVLPPFAAWHSETLPYWALVVSQLALIAVMAVVAVRVHRGALQPGRYRHLAVLAIGSLYFLGMTFRLVAGLTFLADKTWFAASLPALFHLVLAAYVLVVGHYLWRRAKAG